MKFFHDNVIVCQLIRYKLRPIQSKGGDDKSELLSHRLQLEV